MRRDETHFSDFLIAWFLLSVASEQTIHNINYLINVSEVSFERDFDQKRIFGNMLIYGFRSKFPSIFLRVDKV